jgi:hypothetical protein
VAKSEEGGGVNEINIIGGYCEGNVVKINEIWRQCERNISWRLMSKAAAIFFSEISSIISEKPAKMAAA